MTAGPAYDAERHFRTLYDRARGEFAFHPGAVTDWRTWQQAFRPRLRAALGLDRMAADLANHRPTAELAGSEDLGDHVREQWRLWVEPTAPLPFYLLLPKGVSGRMPLVLTPHGHNEPHLYVGIARDDAERRSITEGDRDIAVQAVREGYLALAPTARAFGDTRTAADGQENRTQSCRTEFLHGLLVGRTVVGERVWDISRLLDWALARGGVDPARVAITGNSGGGTVALFAAACDERLAVCVPGSYFCTFRGSIGAIHHCDCNYVPGILQLGEMDDVASLIAPRPFCAVNGRDDPIFPLAEAQAAFERLRRVYAAAGVPDRCELYVGDGGHRYYRAGAWPFIRRHFGRAAAAP
jgi:poly(3-hydroxybutyrate) depolymerase